MPVWLSDVILLPNIIWPGIWTRQAHFMFYLNALCSIIMQLYDFEANFMEIHLQNWDDLLIHALNIVHNVRDLQ